jgi:hypothetical protein
MAFMIAMQLPPRPSPLRRRVTILRAGVLLFGIVGCAAVVCPCARAGDSGVAPPAADPGAKNLDEWLAYVAGEQITRRMIIRQIGERVEGMSEAEQEHRIHEQLLKRVLNGSMVWKSRQFGLELKPDIVDEQVAAAAKFEEEQAKERGTPMPFAQILMRRGQSLEEFKDLLAREALVSNYWRIVMRGMPGKRPQIDAEASPADCAALYAAHKAAFDQQGGVRLATFSARPEDFLERAADYAAAADMAKAHLREMAQEVARGVPAEKVAAAHGLEKGNWAATPASRFLSKSDIALSPLVAWAFDPARHAGEIEIFDAPRGAMAAFVILDVRRAQSRSYEDVLPNLMEAIRSVRLQRFQLQHTLEVLAAAPVKPATLIDEVSDQLREQQKHLDDDPVTRDIRMR